MMLSRFAPLAACALAACVTSTAADDPATDPRVVVTTDRTAYAPGDSVRITVRNVSPQGYGYNLCARVLERRSGGWQAVESSPPPGSACTMELRLLPPGDSVRTGARIPGDAQGGTYRVRFNDSGLATPTFAVAR